MKASINTMIVGVDCAAQHSRIGLALGSTGPNGTTISDVTTGLSSVLPALERWITKDQASVLAFDSPLGWPRDLGTTLTSHVAGAGVRKGSDELFHRHTDEFVREKVRKKPLEVGADKIARAAVSALRVASDLRQRTQKELPLLWETGIPQAPGIIEVYPAATLRAHGLSDKGYKGKKSKHRDARNVLIASLSKMMKFEVDSELLASSDDALDAVVCVLAAVDFINGNVHLPEDLDRVMKEGWIWFRASGPPPRLS